MTVQERLEGVERILGKNIRGGKNEECKVPEAEWGLACSKHSKDSSELDGNVQGE